MKAIALLPLLALLLTGCAATHPHQARKPVKKIIIVAPAKQVSRNVIITKSESLPPAATRSCTIK